jgi:hypothetical protein
MVFLRKEESQSTLNDNFVFGKRERKVKRRIEKDIFCGDLSKPEILSFFSFFRGGRGR